MQDHNGCADLIASQEAMEPARGAHPLARAFPTDERLGVTVQIRRSAVGVPSNIAEGYGRESPPDVLRFHRMARGSQSELETRLLMPVHSNCLRRMLLTSAS
ncbi:MAG: four helix bundle protein [Phycisphaerales bacterium]|nr:four helix bundle protein [Phycisphaerales bacterium]